MKTLSISIFASLAFFMSSCSVPAEGVNETKSTPEASSKETILADLLVVVDMSDYTTWRSQAFDPDATRRATVCKEEQTVVAKVSDQKALVLMYGVDVEKMAGFMNEQVMDELKEKFGATHSVFAMKRPAPGQGPEVSDMLVKVKMDNYNTWRSEAFDPDTSRRATVCEENKTLVGKVSEQEAVVAMFAVNLSKMSEFMTEEAMKQLKEAYGAEHDVYAIARIDQ